MRAVRHRPQPRGGGAFVHIQGQGSGEFLDRAEPAEAEARVEAGEFDLVVVEDLARVCRRNRAIDFCEPCEDAGTHLVAINDAIATARDDWRLNAFFASFKHESANKETAKRIRRSLRNRFDGGGVVQTFPYGYVKPPGPRPTPTCGRTRRPSGWSGSSRAWRSRPTGTTG